MASTYNEKMSFRNDILEKQKEIPFGCDNRLIRDSSVDWTILGIFVTITRQLLIAYSDKKESWDEE